jgi:hypothetical protein
MEYANKEIKTALEVAAISLQSHLSQDLRGQQELFALTSQVIGEGKYLPDNLDEIWDKWDGCNNYYHNLDVMYQLMQLYRPEYMRQGVQELHLKIQWLKLAFEGILITLRQAGADILATKAHKKLLRITQNYYETI